MRFSAFTTTNVVLATIASIVYLSILVNDLVYSGTLFWEQEEVYYIHSD